MNKQEVWAEIRHNEQRRNAAFYQGASIAAFEGRAAELSSYLEEEGEGEDTPDIMFPESYPDTYGE
jgi:hypothetical protein